MGRTVEAAGEEAWMRELKQWRSVQDVVVDNLLNITLKQKRGDSEKLVVGSLSGNTNRATLSSYL